VSRGLLTRIKAAPRFAPQHGPAGRRGASGTFLEYRKGVRPIAKGEIGRTTFP